MIDDLISTDIGDLYFTKGNDLGVRKDGTFLESLPERAFMRKYLKPGMEFIDVGAHVGFMSVYASQLGAYVEAFEPHPDNFKHLRMNFRLHKVNGWAWNEAVGDQLGNESIYESTNNSGDHMMQNSGPTHRLLSTIPITTLDHVIQTVDFIKIDVQGYEYKVLKGACNLIDKQRPIIMLEYSPWHLDVQGLDPHNFLAYLETLPYNVICSRDPYSVPSPEYETLYLKPK